jgi:hypothetical protein
MMMMSTTEFLCWSHKLLLLLSGCIPSLGCSLRAQQRTFPAKEVPSGHQNYPTGTTRRHTTQREQQRKAVIIWTIHTYLFINHCSTIAKGIHRHQGSQDETSCLLSCQGCIVILFSFFFQINICIIHILQGVIWVFHIVIIILVIKIILIIINITLILTIII